MQFFPGSAVDYGHEAPVNGGNNGECMLNAKNIVIGLVVLFVIYNALAWKAGRNVANYFVQCGQETYQKPNRSSDRHVLALELQSCIDAKIGFFERLFITQETRVEK